jgi:hypothetical protein
MIFYGADVQKDGIFVKGIDLGGSETFLGRAMGQLATLEAFEAVERDAVRTMTAIVDMLTGPIPEPFPACRDHGTMAHIGGLWRCVYCDRTKELLGLPDPIQDQVAYLAQHAAAIIAMTQTPARAPIMGEPAIVHEAEGWVEYPGLGASSIEFWEALLNHPEVVGPTLPRPDMATSPLAWRLDR